MELTFDSHLPTHLKYEEDPATGEGHTTIIFSERKVKRITDEQMRVIIYLEKSNLDVRIAINGDLGNLVTRAEYQSGKYESLPDPTLAPTTIANYKTRYKQLKLQLITEESPVKRHQIEEQLHRYEDALGIKAKATTKAYWSKEAREERAKAYIQNHPPTEEALQESASGLEELARLLKDDQDKAERESQQVFKDE